MKLSQAKRMLERRRKCLDARIIKANDEGKDLSFDKAERSAIDVALRVMGDRQAENARRIPMEERVG